MLILGVCFILYFLKLSVGNGLHPDITAVARENSEAATHVL